jgi:hypothetical protein
LAKIPAARSNIHLSFSFDTAGVAPLIDGLAFDGFIADNAFASNSIIADLNERGAKIVVSQHPRRAVRYLRFCAKGAIQFIVGEA